MATPLDQYWALRLNKVQKALESNLFAVSRCESLAEASELVLNTLLPSTGAKSVSFGGSETVTQSGLLPRLAAMPGLHVIDTYDTTPPVEERLERRRQSLLVDLFITSANALTIDGRLVNLDGTGNRVAAMSFGPRNVVLLVGRNKICADLHEAFKRVRTVAAPANCVRLKRDTPCTKTGVCTDCSAPGRICCTWSITAKSSPAGRTHVVLINEELGY